MGLGSLALRGIVHRAAVPGLDPRMPMLRGCENVCLGRVAAPVRMIDEGARSILVAPTDSTALLPHIEAARGRDVLVVAVDTPFDPEESVDA